MNANFSLEKEILVIIRSAGERTLETCYNLILSQGFSPESVKIVEEIPFSRAMVVSFLLGIEFNRKYTLCIDADVLLQASSIESLYLEFEKQQPNVCEIQGLVMDKFFGGPRPAGNHMYRTSLLQNLLDCIPKEGTDIRPEFYSLNKMSERGYPWLNVPIIVGIHDDEQWNRDIYRKCFVHGVKHLAFADLFVPLWKNNQDSDYDYTIALRAFADSIVCSESVFIDRSQPLYEDGFSNTLFTEKNPLSNVDITIELITTQVSNWTYALEYQKKLPLQYGLIKPDEDNKNNLNKIIKKHGHLKMLVFYFGVSLVVLGTRIKKLIEVK
jgi:hypothetical protein